MTIEADERETLHHILDALINARNSLERVEPGTLSPGQQFYLAWSKPRSDLFRDGSLFLRRIIGARLHEHEMSILFNTRLEEDTVGAELAATIANAIRSFLPLFMRQGSYEKDGNNEVIENIVEDLMGIYWGDEPRFFSPWPRRQGLHKRPYRLARLRRTALDWDKYLAAVGVRAQERHNLISEAYRTDWEAIRKWAGSIEEQFDLFSYPPEAEDVERAKQQYEREPESIREAIRMDGDAYWLERGTAQSGKHR